jgi:hypothetical protein
MRRLPLIILYLQAEGKHNRAHPRAALRDAGALRGGRETGKRHPVEVGA